MKQLLVGLLAFTAACNAGMLSAAVPVPAEINVAYFLEWPTPNQFAQVKQTYDSTLGVTVNWVPFKSGYDMNEALQAGDIQIAYSQSHVPFVIGVSDGLDLTMVGIAVVHSGNDNCILRNDSGISRSNASELETKKVATLPGSVSHFKLLKMLAHLKVDASKVEIVAMDTAASAAEALQRGDVVMACAFGSALRSMAQLGEPLMTTGEQEAIGLKLFDIVVTSTEFMSQQPELLQRFMDVTEASNKQWKLNPAPMLASIARAAGMDRQSTETTLQRISFPSASEQISSEWMGEAVVDYTKALADFFVEQGRLEKALDLNDYKRHITTRFLR